MGSRPETFPTWAESGAVVEPTEGDKASGWFPNNKLPAPFENWLGRDRARWLRYLDPLSGDGAPGRLLTVRDDFLGDQLDRGLWVPTTSNAIVQLADDSAVGGSGSLKLDCAAAGAWS